MGSQSVSPEGDLSGHADLTALENSGLSAAFLSLCRDGEKTMRLEAFAALVHVSVCPSLSASLHRSRCPTGPMDWPTYRDLFVDLVRSYDSTPLQIVLDILSADAHLNQSARLSLLFRVLMECAGYDDDMCPSMANSLAALVSEQADKAGLPCVQHIVMALPCASHVLRSFFFARMCPGIAHSKTYSIPRLDAPSSIAAQLSTVFPLTLHSSSLQGRWTQLYSSDKHGFSFNRIAHHLLGYHVRTHHTLQPALHYSVSLWHDTKSMEQGPTCLLIRCAGSEATIGAYAEARWHDSNRFYGTSEAFLFALTPVLRILGAEAGGNQAFQWLNLKTLGQPHGLGFGGSKEKFRLFIPDSLEQCQAHRSCPTFEPGPLLPPECKDMFEVQTLELWGCGGEEAISSGLTAQKKDRDVRDENIRKAKKVDKAAFFNNTFDQEMFLSKTFAHKSGGDTALGR